MSLEVLSRQFADHSNQVLALATDVKDVRATIDDLAQKVGALTVGGGGDGEPSKANRLAELKALASFARSGDKDGLKQIHAQMSGDVDPEGGFFDLPTFSSGMTQKLQDAVVIRKLSRVETVTTGSVWQELLDLDDVEAEWVGERQERPETDTGDYGVLSVHLREVMANAPITQNLLDDAGYNLGAHVEGKIVDKFGRSEDSKFITGDGVLTPRGFLTYPTSSAIDANRAWGTIQHVATGAAADFATSEPADCLKTLAWSLRAPYRKGAVFVLNSNTASRIDKMKNGDGEYIWRSSMTAGAPNLLLGHPVEFSESMPDIGANSYPIAFANWKRAFVIVDRAGVRFIRDDLTRKPMVLFYATKRVGSGLANSEAIKLLKVAAS